jgi:WXG100 family type VII secretion target
MSNTIQVTTNTLTTKANELKNLNSQFKKNVETLRTQESSLNSMWEGEAKDAFHSAFTSDATQMDNFYNAIEKYVASLLEIVAKYEAAEKKNLSTAQTRSYK